MVGPEGLAAAKEREVGRRTRRKGARALPTGLKSGIRSSGLFEAAGCW